MDKKKMYYNIPTNSKIVGRKINKTRLGNSKIFKNLSKDINLTQVSFPSKSIFKGNRINQSAQ